MIFHTFGNDSCEAILLIHGMLNPWQIWKEVSIEQSQAYEEGVDAFVIDVNHIEKYQDPRPFLISGISADHHLDCIYLKYQRQCLGFITKQ